MKYVLITHFIVGVFKLDFRIGMFKRFREPSIRLEKKIYLFRCSKKAGIRWEKSVFFTIMLLAYPAYSQFCHSWNSIPSYGF
jgi:hypothetical protein